MTSLEIRFRAEDLEVIKQFISGKIREANADGVVIGVSGGLDSAVVLKIATLILPNEKITPVFLPESTTPELDTTHAHKIGQECDFDLITIPIDHLVKAYMTIPEITEPNQLSLGNLKARIRMNILYFIGNSTNRLILGTSNKSELLLGYFTKFGDGASDIAPLGDIYKTQVKELARYLEIPDDIITKPPTAGLITGQTDEDELGLGYDAIDKILFGLERDISVAKLAEILHLADGKIEEIKSRVEYNRHKRKFPKIPKIGLKTIGLDLYE